MALSPAELKQLEAMDAKGELTPELADTLNQYKAHTITKTPKNAAPAPLVNPLELTVPESAKGYGADLGADIAGDMTKAGKTMAPAVAPTGLGLVGAGLGALSRIPGAPAAGEAGGNVLGEWINQQIGLTEESDNALIAAGVIPATARGGAKVIKEGYRLIPGKSAALQEEGVAMAREIPKTHITPPAQSSERLFGLLDTLFHGNAPTISTQKLTTHSDDLLRNEAHVIPAAQNAKLRSMAEGFLSQNGRMTIEQMRANMKRLNDMIANKENGEIKGGLMLLKRGMHEDLEYAMQHGGMTGPGMDPALAAQGADILKSAMKAARKELATEDLAQIIESKVVKGGEFLDTISGNQIWNTMKKDPFLMASFDKSELRAIEKTLADIEKIPRVPIKRGTPIGSGRKIGTIGAVGTTVAGGGMAGGLDPAMATMASGAAMYAVDKGTEMLARAMTNEKGRWFVRKLFQASKGNYGENEAGALASFLNAIGEGGGKEVVGDVLDIIGE